MHSVDLLFYPGWVRKAITFTIDDGKVPYDQKFIEIMKPTGIKGTFNLCSNTLDYVSPEQYRKIYADYEIANHCKYHPYAFEDGEEYLISDEPFVEDQADKQLVYYSGEENLYWIHNGVGWRRITDGEHYCSFIRQCHQDLEKMFGAGRVRSFVWPFKPQKNKVIVDFLKNFGYYGSRGGRVPMDEEIFALPENRFDWIFTANHTNLLDLAKRFENCQDGKTLKFFCFGVHSIDFEQADKWGDLQAFADHYGYRPQDYYYGTVGEIFDYADSLKKIIVQDDVIENPTDTDVYIVVDGKKVVIEAKSIYAMDKNIT